jgi:hypothetical protein
MRFDDRVGNLGIIKQAKVIHFEIDPLKWTKCKTEVAS